MSSWEGFEPCHHWRGLNCVIMGGVCTGSLWEGFALCHHGRDFNCVTMGDFALCHCGTGLNGGTNGVIMRWV